MSGISRSLSIQATTMGSNRSVIAVLSILCFGSLLMNVNYLLMSSTPTSTTPSVVDPVPAPSVPSTTNNITVETVNGDSHNTLPRCDTLMQYPASPFADGAFLTRKTTQVVWKMRHDGSRELTLPQTCQLKRYTAQQAGKCLKNKSLLFIGDSLTRYQFLSLAYFIEHKRWPMRFQTSGNYPCKHVDEEGNAACSKPNEPSVCCEYDWEKANGGWAKFMQELGGDTDGGIFHGRMEAQSVRATVSIEGYQYVSSKEDGGVKLSLVSEYGWGGTEPFRGWNFTGCAHEGTCRYTPESYQKNIERNAQSDFDWDYPNIATAFSSDTGFRSQYQNTSYIFYNRGLWGAIQDGKAKTMIDAFRHMTGGKDEKSNRCFFRSTTGGPKTRANNLHDIEYGFVRNTAYEYGCEFFDVAHVTEEFSQFIFNHLSPLHANEFAQVFWDVVHYVPWVYEEINNLMLNVLCNTLSLDD